MNQIIKMKTVKTPKYNSSYIGYIWLLINSIKFLSFFFPVYATFNASFMDLRLNDFKALIWKRSELLNLQKPCPLLHTYVIT